MISYVLIAGVMAMQSAAALTPEAVCGPEYHEFSLEPVYAHAVTTASMDDALSGKTAVEGIVLSKHTYADHGIGPVENEIQLRVTKVLKGTLTEGALIAVHVAGGFAPRDHICQRDTVDDGARVEVGGLYLVPLTKEAETGAYRSGNVAGWFRISQNGSIVPLTPALIRNHVFSDKKITDFEERAKALR